MGIVSSSRGRRVHDGMVRENGRGDCKTPIQTSRDRLGNWSPGELETWGSEEEEIVEIWSREGKGSAGMEYTIQARQTDTDRQTETDRWTDR